MLPCDGAHACSWKALAQLVPPGTNTSILEVARRAPWGFSEYAHQRSNADVAHFLRAPGALVNGLRSSSRIALFHILVGEGVARDKLRDALTQAMRAGVDEVWAMEHNREGTSWANRKSWPVGHLRNPPREPGSELFTLDELRGEMASLATQWCDGTRASDEAAAAAEAPFHPEAPAARHEPHVLAACLIPTAEDPAGRNMLVGVKCACRGHGHESWRWGTPGERDDAHELPTRAHASVNASALPSSTADNVATLAPPPLPDAGPQPTDAAGHGLAATAACEGSLFCCVRTSGQAASKATLYGGVGFTYTFHADPPATIAATIAKAAPALASGAPRVEHGGGSDARGLAFATVIGGLSGLNLLSQQSQPGAEHGSSVLPSTPRAITFFDINPWVLEYARMVVEVITLSPSRHEYVGRMFSRNVSRVLNTTAGTMAELQPAHEAPFMALAMDVGLAAETQARLTPASRCAHEWLTREVVTQPVPKAPPPQRRVCEHIKLFFPPTQSPKLNPYAVSGKCKLVSPNPRALHNCLTQPNQCTLYYGSGWLATEATYASVRRMLSAAPIEFKLWNLYANTLRQLVDAASYRTVVAYLSNAPYFGGGQYNTTLRDWQLELEGATATRVVVVDSQGAHVLGRGAPAAPGKKAVPKTTPTAPDASKKSKAQELVTHPPPPPWQPMRQTACDLHDWTGCREALTRAIFNASTPPLLRPPNLALPFAQLFSRIKNHTRHQPTRPPAGVHALIWTTRSRFLALNSTVLWSTTSVAADSSHLSPVGSQPHGCDTSTSRLRSPPLRCHRRSDTLVVYHRGHEARDCNADVDGLVAYLNALGYDTFEMWMPFYACNSPPWSRTPNLPHETLMPYEARGDHTMRFFIEPVALAVAFATGALGYTHVAMIGLSCGGWTTTLAAAVLPALRLSIPIAATVPSWPTPIFTSWVRNLPESNRRMYHRLGVVDVPGTGGDYEHRREQPYFLAVGGYAQLYVLGTVEAGRLQLQILHEDDDCCYSAHGVHGPIRDYNAHVQSHGAGWMQTAVTQGDNHVVNPRDRTLISLMLEEMRRRRLGRAELAERLRVLPFDLLTDPSTASRLPISQNQVPINISSPIPASMKRDDHLERIGKLKELLDKGAITEAEFAEKKAKLLVGV